MSSVVELDPSAESVAFSSIQKPKPLASLTAAAQRLSSKELKRIGHSSNAESWQDDAWDMYDLVGEQRFLASTLANRLAQARFFVGKQPADTTEDLEVVNEGDAYDAFSSMVGRGAHFTQTISRLGLNLFMAGDGYLMGTPPKPTTEPDSSMDPAQGISPVGVGDFANIDIDSLDWEMYSISELQVDDKKGDITVTRQGTHKYKADDVVLIRVWRPHPRYWAKADSPTRSSLPVLRELVGLTMHISAQVDSRLAGAGILFVPASADQALRAAAGSPLDGDDISNPFAEALMEAMIQPISDRSNASAVVPLMPVVPDDSIDKFRFMSFAGALDAEARALRDEAIRRLALGQDCPPELLLGVGGMNHWGAWLVREDVVTTHLEPPLALICDAITTQFLWPLLEEQGVENFREYVIWYDVDHMIQRPNRSQDAKDAHTAGVINDPALRDALGFDETDAPDVDPQDPAIQMALDMLRQAPSLAQSPGISMLAEQIRAMLSGTVVPVGTEQSDPEAAPAVNAEDEGSDTPAPAEGTIPATDNDSAAEPGDAE